MSRSSSVPRKRLELLDTSVLLEILDVPYENDRFATVAEEFDAKVEAGVSLQIPMATVLETGAHIRRIKEGDARRTCARTFTRFLDKTLSGTEPWSFSPFSWDADVVRALLEGTDLVIIAATMGGGLGTGAAPVVAEIAHDMGILSIGVVTTPFHFEMPRKMQTAQAGIARMRGYTDAFITIRNDNLLKIAPDRNMSFVDAFAFADEVLRHTVGCVAELILTTGIVNVDFSDVTTIFRQSASSDTLLAIGADATPQKAVRKAIESPLIDRGITGARGIVLNLTGGPAMSLRDVDEAVHYIHKNAHPEVNIIAGLVVQPEMEGKVQATLIATDFDDTYAPPAES